MDVFLTLGQEAAGAGGRVVHGDDLARGDLLLLVGEQQRRGQVHDVARGEVLTGSVVGGFGEAADQLLEDQAHLVVAVGLGAEVRAGKALDDLVKQVGVVELFQEVLEAEVLEDLPRRRTEVLDVVIQVVQHLVLAQAGQVHGRGVVELQSACGLLQEGPERQVRVLALVVLGQQRLLGGGQDALQAP